MQSFLLWLQEGPWLRSSHIFFKPSFPVDRARLRQVADYMLKSGFPNNAPLVCSYVNGFYMLYRGYYQLLAALFKGLPYVLVVVLRLSIHSDQLLSERVHHALLGTICEGNTFRSDSDLAQCLKIKTVYQEIWTGKQRARERNNRLSAKPTLNEVAGRLFPGWPQNLGAPQVSFLLMHTKRTVEKYWRDVLPLLQTQSAIEQLLQWESQGLIDPWQRTALSRLRGYTAAEVQQAVEGWAVERTYKRERTLLLPRRGSAALKRKYVVFTKGVSAGRQDCASGSVDDSAYRESEPVLKKGCPVPI